MNYTEEEFKQKLLLGGRPLTIMEAWEDPQIRPPESYQETTIFTAATVYEETIGLYSCPSAHVDISSAGIMVSEFSYFPLAGVFTVSSSRTHRKAKIMPLAYYKSFSLGCRTRHKLQLKRSSDHTLDPSIIAELSAASRSGSKPQIAIETTCGRLLSLATHMIYFYKSGGVRILFSPIVSNKILFFAPLFATNNLKPCLSRLPCSDGHSLTELAKTGFTGFETEELPPSWIIPNLSPDFRTLNFSIIDPTTSIQKRDEVTLEVLTVTAGFDI